ncbi:VOC family protein [Streptomyces sp. NBC_00083]|uniref:VOC family protein n=1 Tax=Streptomyces sp. NBC_00083 TaxID=2975647 RepID=UPI00225385FA|nr:VOC family protein [Streptomyces sp. NBC_00083]MCX5384751.1 VOC family protein [Streptomyces sp. NBC_00083]
MTNELQPKLLVSDADAAIDFYTKALGASLTDRVADDQGLVMHAEFSLAAGTFALAQSVEEWGWNDPLSIGGSPVLLQIDLPDPVAAADRMAQLGGEIVIPVEDRPYGKRQGRVKDPFGHLWVLSGAIPS